MRQAVNILFLGGAKRVEMARLFKRSALARGIEANIFSYELSPEVPIALEASVIIGRRWADPDILTDIHQVVIDNRIDIIIPFVDPAVAIAAKYCHSDGQCFTPSASAELAADMFDKVVADSLFRKAAIALPPDPDNAPMVIAKERCGSASKGIRILSREEYLELLKNPDDASRCLFQAYIADREEYSVDAFVNSDGSFVCAVPRKRLEVSGGEVTSTVTIHAPELVKISRHALAALGLTGACTLQFLRQKGVDHAPYMLMEINPRLGGGAVCSVHAGADIPGYILDEWLGHPATELSSWKENLRLSRYPADVIFLNNTLLTSL